MFNKSLRVAILTGNNSPGEQYLTRLFRSEFDNVIVAAVKNLIEWSDEFYSRKIMTRKDHHAAEPLSDLPG